jgi:hypothetical protein
MHIKSAQIPARSGPGSAPPNLTQSQHPRAARRAALLVGGRSPRRAGACSLLLGDFVQVGNAARAAWAAAGLALPAVTDQRWRRRLGGRRHRRAPRCGGQGPSCLRRRRRRRGRRRSSQSGAVWRQRGSSCPRRRQRRQARIGWAGEHAAGLQGAARSSGQGPAFGPRRKRENLIY